MTVMIAFLLFLGVMALLLVAYSCCVVAGRADDDDDERSLHYPRIVAARFVSDQQEDYERRDLAAMDQLRAIHHYPRSMYGEELRE